LSDIGVIEKNNLWQEVIPNEFSDWINKEIWFCRMGIPFGFPVLPEVKIT
jgi:hypothetical protein